jgi:hypothetical protein
MTSDVAFPQLCTSSKQLSSNLEHPSFLKTIGNVETNTDDDDSTYSKTDVLFDYGWIELTKDTYRQKQKPNEQRREERILKTTKDPFIYRILCKERYIHSLNDQQYSILANETMNKVVDIYQRQAAEFIEMHGQEYYDHIYGYEPVYGKRVMRRARSSSSGNSDMTSLTGVYHEYYTDDDENYNEEGQPEEDEEFDEY